MTEETNEPKPRGRPKREPQPDAKPTCGACWFFTEEGGIVKAGKCHRYPATESKAKRDWCGEFKPGATL